MDSFTVEIFDEKSFTKDERIAYATIPIPTQLFDGETVNEFYNLSGKQGLDQEGQGMAQTLSDNLSLIRLSPHTSTYAFI